MPKLLELIRVRRFKTLVKRWKGLRYLDIDNENLQAISAYPPGHFYSPLLDMRNLPDDESMDFDGEDLWGNIDLRRDSQKELFASLLVEYPSIAFPDIKTEGFRYYKKNQMFSETDAYTLSALLRKLKPKRIIEVGSGFSSAVMLDTMRQSGLSAEMTFIEPYPERLYSLLDEKDRKSSQIMEMGVQGVPVERFTSLKENDFLFIDSSHVAKIGSDVTFLLLKILPILAPGVWVHLHDIFYPFTYPARWLKEGRAWNEGLFLRAFLLGNTKIEVTAFNSFAARVFPELFEVKLPIFVQESGSSIWLRTVA